MTITYTGKVANARLGAFSRLLFYWKGSIYKLMYKEMIIFVILYTGLSLTYRFVLNEWQKSLFERIALYCQTFTNLIPLSFVLGFYVAIVVTRWWNQYMNIPWPDKCMLYVNLAIDGVDEKSRLLRRTLMRYLSLASLLVFQGTSTSVKRRFPTMGHLVEAGVMSADEYQIYESVNTPHGKWWLPFVWCTNILRDTFKEGKISSDYLLKTLIEEFMEYRGLLGNLYSYDWISIPLVYTQVTTLAVYTFFVGCTFGRQFLDPKKQYPGHDVDLYVPVFTLLQFFFYMGWLKVAEQLINPFGEDDDDFEMNWIIDRNMQVSHIVVDDLHTQYPKMQKDVFWDETMPAYLPYTKSAITSMKKPFMGSTAELSVPDDNMEMVTPMETIQEGVTMQFRGHSHLNVSSNYASPLSSPGRGRRYQNNMLNTVRLANLSSSKSTLDGLRITNEKLQKQLGSQPNGSGASNKSYMEGWIQEHSHQFESPAKTKSSTSKNTENGYDNESIAITIDDDGMTDDNMSMAETGTQGESDQMFTMDPEPVAENIVQEIPIIDIIPPSSSVLDEVKVWETILEERSRHSSESSYEHPDSNQSTVTSITPLLKDATSEEKLAMKEVISSAVDSIV